MNKFFKELIEAFFKETVTSEEASALKKFVRSLSMYATLGIVFGYLVLLDMLPRFTLAVTLLAFIAFGLMHLLRKWAKST